MGQLEDILKHQNMVRNNIMKSFGAETSEDSLEKSFEDEVNPFEMEAYKSELTKAELDEFEKAKHQDGDMHPNGKWVWRQSANGGKGDWRVAKPGGSKATAGGAAAATTKTNTAAKTSSSALSDKEKNAFADIMKKNSSHKDAHMNLEQMSDDELRKFANAASVLAGDKTNLNDKTRANIKGWMKLAHDEQTARRNNKKTSNTVTHDINGTKVTVTKNSDGSYTLEANGKKVKSDDPSFFVNGNNLKPRIKAALAKEVGLEIKKTSDKKKPEKSSFESKEADAYDKGDGKVGNYPVPTHTSYPASNLYSRLKNNRHFGFKYGLPEEEIMKKLKDYKGNVKVSYHNNAGTSEIYRIKFL